MIRLFCYRGAGDKEMDPVEDSLIASEEMARKRGKYEIDKQWYLVHLQDIQIPYRDRDSGEILADGDMIEVSDAVFGISGSRRIKRILISGTPMDLSIKLGIAEFEEFV